MPRLRLTLPFAVACAAAVAVPAALDAHPLVAPVTISVTAGKPRELLFTVRPAHIAASSALFKVTNKGKQSHAFKVCAKPAATSVLNTCAGHATKTLAPGATATLVVKFSASGTYEYLSANAAQAAAGMKGALTVTVPTASAGGSTPSSSSSPSSGSSSSSGGAGSSGGVVNGQAVDPACPAGTYVPVGPNAGDLDDDNEGGFATDNDGCL